VKYGPFALQFVDMVVVVLVVTNACLMPARPPSAIAFSHLQQLTWLSL
jgi:hypothetical protein